jgi:hypothetical protein
MGSVVMVMERNMLKKLRIYQPCLRKDSKKIKGLGGGNHGTQYKSKISISNNTPISIAYAINQLRPEPERGRPLSRASKNRLSMSELSAPVLRRPLAPRLGLPIRLCGVGSFD